jgi:hypothetical protein
MGVVCWICCEAVDSLLRGCCRARVAFKVEIAIEAGINFFCFANHQQRHSELESLNFLEGSVFSKAGTYSHSLIFGLFLHHLPSQ